MSLVTRLLVLIALAMVPVLAGQLYSLIELQHQRDRAMRADAARYTRLVSADALRLIEGVQGILIAVSEIPFVRSADPAACPAYLQALALRYPEIHNITLINEAAKPVCANTPIPPAATAKDRFDFHEALRTNDFVIGNIIVEPTVPGPRLPVALPFNDGNGHRLVLSVGLDFDWLQKHFGSLPLPLGASLWIADRDGIVVVAPSDPTQVGHPLPPDMRPAMQADSGTFQRVGDDGTAHIVGFDPANIPPVGLVVAVDLSQRELALSADTGSARDLAVLLASMLAAAVLAWFGARHLVSRPLHIVTAVAHEWANGRYDVRARLFDRTSEIGRLGLAFDSMADAVQANQQALERLNQTLEKRVEERTAELLAANLRLEAEMAERLKAEAALRQSQKMEAIGQLTGGIAHDFNNLLTAIGGSIDFMARSLPPSDSRAQRFATLAHESVGRAAKLTHRLLAFARQQPLEIQVVDLTQLVTGMTELLSRVLGEAIEVETILTPCPPPVWSDPAQIENALLNLAVNARDAMPNGGRLTIEVANATLDDKYADDHEVMPGDYVMLAVSDTGLGMSPETIARAFDPFFTTKPVGKGTGLGLSMVYGFAKQSGGYATIDSQPGKGSTIKLYLPRMNAAACAPPPPASIRPSVPDGRGTVLVVEDDPAVRELSIGFLHDLGYVVLSAPDAATALDIVRGNEAVDLIFTDVVLSGDIDGRQLASHALALRPGLRILFTSGYAPATAVPGGGIETGVNLLPKPFSAESLAAKLALVMQGT
jgi:signal transduction histidine kinase